MSVEALAAWLLGIMLATAPPGDRRCAPTARETKAQGEARYAAIARAIAEVSLDPKERSLFDGKDGRRKTAALLLAVSQHESHWRRDVDLGIGRYSPRGRRRYHCMMQIAVDRGRTAEGWTATQLVQSRQRCFRSGLHILQRGRRFCDSTGPRAFLNHYASGYCDRGRKAVKRRWGSFNEMLRKHPYPAPLPRKAPAPRKRR